MSRPASMKKKRQLVLNETILQDPFITDEELADTLGVSIPTVRLDRLELGIPELRERVRTVAKRNFEKVKSLESKELVGELIDIELGHHAISMLETDDSMAFEKTKIIQGRFIYSLAESLAIAVIDTHVALVGVANIKYSIPCYSGSRLIAKADVKEIRNNNRYIVWIEISSKQTNIFRGKFILVSLEKMIT